jgi:hypothetical protein
MSRVSDLAERTSLFAGGALLAGGVVVLAAAPANAECISVPYVGCVPVPPPGPAVPAVPGAPEEAVAPLPPGHNPGFWGDRGWCPPGPPEDQLGCVM